MKLLVPIIVVTLVLAHRAEAATNSAALVQVDSRDFGDTNCLMKIVELERNTNTSKLRLTYRKMASSVGSSLFLVRGFYEVAKARGVEYFINLKEWDDPEGGRIFIAGFTNKEDADLKKEFGEAFTYDNDHGQKRSFMSVSQFTPIFERPRNNCEPKGPE